MIPPLSMHTVTRMDTGGGKVIPLLSTHTVTHMDTHGKTDKTKCKLAALRQCIFMSYPFLMCMAIRVNVFVMRGGITFLVMFEKKRG